MAKHLLAADHTVYIFSPDSPPALTVEPGDQVVFELLDVGRGQFRTDNDLYDPATYDHEHDHPMTGPVAVASAEPGDALLVHIDDIQLWDWGFILQAPEVGVLRNRMRRRSTRVVPIRNGYCEFNAHIRFPIRAMVGTIGVAPPTGSIRGVLPGPHGGNLDNIHITTGSTVYLPVNAPGALLAMGDLHAAMGDGEICISGVETGGSVLATIHLCKGRKLSRPLVETDTLWMTMGDGRDLQEATRVACDEMLNLLTQEWSLSPEDAFMLMSVEADLGICQCADPDTIPCVARMAMPKLPGLPGPFRTLASPWSAAGSRS